MSRKQRLNNLKDAFRLNHDIEGKNIALIDDVVTTGSTMSNYLDYSGKPDLIM
ncbi:MAG: putative amidophosphoribosyltransferase [Porticoccus sp.]